MVSLKLSRPPSLVKTAFAALIINVLVQQFVAEKENSTLSIRSGDPDNKAQKPCEISMDNMIGLKKTGNKALAMSSNRSSEEVICDYDLQTILSGYSCMALMEFVLCSTNYLNKEFSNVSKEKENSKGFKQWKIAYDALYNGVDKLLDGVKHPTQLTHAMLNMLKQNIKTSALPVSKKDIFIKELTKTHIASDLDSGLLESALQRYAQIGSDIADIPDIVNLTYTYTSKSHDMILAKFISKLKTPQHKGIGYRKLLELMEASKNTDSYSVVYLNYLVNLLSTEKNLNSSIYESLIKTKDKLKPYVEGVIDGWAHELRSGKSNSSLYLASREENFSDVIFNHTDKFITKAYSGVAGNTENILKFIKPLKDFVNMKTVIRLYYLMRDYDHFDSYQFIMVAYRVKQLLLSKANETNRAMISDLERIRKDIPKTIRLLIWNLNSCTIRHSIYGEYLYSPETLAGFLYSKIRRYVFTWVPDDVMNDKFRWDLKTDNEGRTFTIRNVRFKEYLYPTIYRYAVTWMYKTVTQGSWWTLYPYEGKFLLYSDPDYSSSNKFLIALNDEENDFTYNKARRNVYGVHNPNIKSCHEKHLQGFVKYDEMHKCQQSLHEYFWEIDCKPYN